MAKLCMLLREPSRPCTSTAVGGGLPDSDRVHRTCQAVRSGPRKRRSTFARQRDLQEAYHRTLLYLVGHTLHRGPPLVGQHIALLDRRGREEKHPPGC